MWGGCYEAMAALSLWLSKLHVCRGWLAAWETGGHAGSGPGEEAASLAAHKSTNVCLFYTWSPPAKLIQMQSCSWWPPFSFEETGGFLAACSWVSGFAGGLSGRRLIKTGGDAPPPLFPTHHLKLLSLSRHPSLPPSPTRPCRRVHTGALFSSLFIFVYLSFFRVQCFCLSDGGVFKWPPSPVSQPLFGLKAMLFMTGRTCRQENEHHVPSPWL